MEAVSKTPLDLSTTSLTSANSDLGLSEAAEAAALVNELDTNILPPALPEAAKELGGKLNYWLRTYNVEVDLNIDVLKEASHYLDPRRSPVPGIALTSVPDRDQLWSALDPSDSKAAILASMALARSYSGINGAMETNPKVLPPTPFLLDVVASGADPDVKELALVCIQKNIPARDRLSEEQRGRLVAAMADHISQHPRSSGVPSTCKALNIKDVEFSLAV